MSFLKKASVSVCGFLVCAAPIILPTGSFHDAISFLSLLLSLRYCYACLAVFGGCSPLAPFSSVRCLRPTHETFSQDCISVVSSSR